MHKRNSNYVWVILTVILLIILVCGGWFLHSKQQAAAAQKQLQAVLNKAKRTHHGDVVLTHVHGATILYLLPKSVHTPSATVRRSAKAELPETGRARAVIATVTREPGTLGLTAERANYTSYHATARHLFEHDDTDDNGVMLNAKTGQPATLADIVPNDYCRRAIDYAAKEELAGRHHLSADAIQALLAKPLLASMAARNFRLTRDSLTITTLGGHTLATIPLSHIGMYLRGGKSKQMPGKVVALTFDDGPNVKTTPSILKTLAAAHAKATFFMVGTGLTTYPDVARQVEAAGHEIGIHTFDHKYLPGLTPAAARDEIYGKMTNTYYKVFGKLPVMLRPPYGAISKPVATEEDLPAIQWSVDSQDWKSKNAKAVLARISATTYSGSIILMHDTQPASVQALPQVIKMLKARGYRFVTVSQLLGQRLLPGHQYFGRGDERLVNNAK